MSTSLRPGITLRFAADNLRRDREIVLTAVRRSGVCLELPGGTPFPHFLRIPDSYAYRGVEINSSPVWVKTTKSI